MTLQISLRLRHSTFFLLSLLITPVFGWNTPTHTAPTNGGPAWVGANVDWSPVAASQAYQVQVDTTANFNSPLLFSATQLYINSTDGNGDTRRSLSDLRFGTTYHWRVRAYVPGDTSTWSTPWTFNTRDFVTLTSPATGTDVWTGLTMDWTVHVGVTWYDAQVDTSTSFGTSALREVSNAYINSTDGNGDTRWFLNDLYFGKTYHWRVRARNAIDSSAWSEVRSFNTRDFVNLTSPNDLALNQNVNGITLNWAPHVGITTYQVQWDTTFQFNSGLLQAVSKPYTNSTDGNSDTQHPSGPLLTDQWYLWQVRAINAVDTSAWSQRRFSTGSTLPIVPAIPNLVAPANGSIVSTALTDLLWSSATNATAYQYRFSTAPDLAGAQANNVQTHSVQVGPLNVGSTYYWSVRAVNATDASAWSAIWSFTFDPTTGIEEDPRSDLMLFPNPSPGMVTILVQRGTAEHLMLRDTGGRLVRADRVTGQRIELDLSDLPEGNYLLQLHTSEGVLVRAVVRGR